MWVDGRPTACASGAAHRLNGNRVGSHPATKKAAISIGAQRRRLQALVGPKPGLAFVD
jgi:hypothetical protein